MQATTSHPVLKVSADGAGVVSHAGSRLIADLAETVVLPAAFADAFTASGGTRRRVVPDPGRVLADVAVMLADGGESIGDLAVLRDQPEVFGAVASVPTVWRVLDSIDEKVLGELRQARARARARAWMLRAEAGRRLNRPGFCAYSVTCEQPGGFSGVEVEASSDWCVSVWG